MKVIALLKKEKSVWAYGWGGKSYARPFASSFTWVKLFVTFLLACIKSVGEEFFSTFIGSIFKGFLQLLPVDRRSLYQIVSPHQSISVCLSRVYLVCNQIFNTKLCCLMSLKANGRSFVKLYCIEDDSNTAFRKCQNWISNEPIDESKLLDRGGRTPTQLIYAQQIVLKNWPEFLEIFFRSRHWSRVVLVIIKVTNSEKW